MLAARDVYKCDGSNLSESLVYNSNTDLPFKNASCLTVTLIRTQHPEISLILIIKLLVPGQCLKKHCSQRTSITARQ